MTEECKVKLRNDRRDANEEFKTLKKNAEISEDQMHDYQQQVQKMTDEYIEKAEGILGKKEKEIMEI
jgi:ribosome recycling factor